MEPPTLLLAAPAPSPAVPDPETYLGILWGLVDGYNSLSFYNGAALIGTVTGSDVMASPGGDQGANGTAYVNINATGGSAFDRVVVTSGGNSFEFDDVAFNETISALSLGGRSYPRTHELGTIWDRAVGTWIR